jgi:NTP pyrophosphatase (non-canonical NTP hydrolase)
MLELNEYQKKAHETASYPCGLISGDNINTPVNYLYPALGLAEEAGEVAGKYAKALRDCSGEIDEKRKAAIVKELGDVMWFVAELATCLEVDLDLVAEMNLQKLASRKERGKINGDGDDR